MRRASRPLGVIFHDFGIRNVKPSRRSTACVWSWKESRPGVKTILPFFTRASISALVRMAMAPHYTHPQELVEGGLLGVSRRPAGPEAAPRQHARRKAPPSPPSQVPH